MSKTQADDVLKLSITVLKKIGCLKDWYHGDIVWTRRGAWGEHKSTVGLSVSTLFEDKYIQLVYTQTDRDTDEKRDFNYKIPLTTTPCRYGGIRYWFICPWYKNGNYCGKRVGTLYKDGDNFACRHCYNLTYESRNASGKYKGFVSIADVEDAEKEVKRMYYDGEPTRKYKRYIKKRQKFEIGFTAMEMRIHKMYKKLDSRTR